MLSLAGAAALLLPLAITDPLWRAALLAADAAAVVSVLVAGPVALGLWWGGGAAILLLGTVLAILPAAGLSVASLAGQPLIWVLATAATGLPVVVVAMLARLTRIAPSSLRIAAVGGLGPLARFRYLLWPLMRPGALGGGLIVYLAVVADSLLPAGTALVLPGASVTAGLLAVLARARP